VISDSTRANQPFGSVAKTIDCSISAEPKIFDSITPVRNAMKENHPHTTSADPISWQQNPCGRPRPCTRKVCRIQFITAEGGAERRWTEAGGS